MNETWAILELMGHVRLGGRVGEEERFGVKMGRIDIPTPEGGFVTQLFGGSSVYRMTFVGEAEARAVALHQQPRPVHSWEMPKSLPASSGPVCGSCDEDLAQCVCDEDDSDF